MLGKKKQIDLKVSLIVATVFLVIVFPVEGFSTTSGVEKFGGSYMNTLADDILHMAAGPWGKLAGALGGAWGILNSILAASIKPLISFGGVSLAVLVLPSFITSVFPAAATLLK